MEKPERQQEISNLQDDQREDSPGERFPEGTRCYVSPHRHNGRSCEHPYQELRKIHRVPRGRIEGVANLATT